MATVFASVRPSLTVGGRVFIDLTNLIQVCSIMNAGGNTTFRKDYASAGYQITAAKTYYISAARTQITTVEAGGRIDWGYGDNDIGQGTTTAATNLKYQGNSAAFGTLRDTGVVGNQETSFSRVPMPAQKYPQLVYGTTMRGNTWLYGYEE